MCILFSKLHVHIVCMRCKKFCGYFCADLQKKRLKLNFEFIILMQMSNNSIMYSRNEYQTFVDF